MVNLKANNQRLSAIIPKIMDVVHANYILDSGLQDSFATANLTNMSVSEALSAIGRVSTRPFTYQVFNGVYRFSLVNGQNLNSQKVTLQVQSSSLGTVIHSMMDGVHANYIIDPEIENARESSVTINLLGVSFPVALDSLLKASSLPIGVRQEKTGQPESTLYHFMLKAKADELEAKASGKIKYLDASLAAGGDLGDKLVSTNLQDVFLSHAIKQILDSVHVRYEIDEGVIDSVISVNLTEVTLKKALNAIMKTSGQSMHYHFENDVLRFLPGKK